MIIKEKETAKIVSVEQPHPTINQVKPSKITQTIECEEGYEASTEPGKEDTEGTIIKCVKKADKPKTETHKGDEPKPEPAKIPVAAVEPPKIDVQPV